MKRKLLITGIVTGCLLMLGPLIGMFATMFGMQRAFDKLGSSGMNDPGQLASEIGQVLFASFAGMVALPIGILLAGFCLFFLFRLRQVPPSLPAGSADTEIPPP